MNKDHEIEDISEEDINNLDEIETYTYTPTCVEDDLECCDEAYHALEYIDLDWPSQTVAPFQNDYLLVGTNPEKEKPKLQKFDVNNITEKNFEVCEAQTDVSYNRIRANHLISCVSDNTFDVYNSNLEKVDSLSFDEGVGYGLCTNDNSSIFSTNNGLVHIYTYKEVENFKIHTKSIECLNIYDNLLFSCSTDKSVKITDLRNKNQVFSKTLNSEINSVDYNKDNVFAYGDDEGTIRVVDMRMSESELGIFWHKTSISMIKWKDSDMFCSASDEQLCIFDITLEDEWEYEKYLLFVHQGQKYYKDICFSPRDINMVVTTSVDGLCMFKPISFE
ncbi:hypothetical protein P3W45_001162 [Vairimorpha bombi]|jgi:ribosome assembly protein RRB1